MAVGDAFSGMALSIKALMASSFPIHVAAVVVVVSFFFLSAT